MRSYEIREASKREKACIFFVQVPKSWQSQACPVEVWGPRPKSAPWVTQIGKEVLRDANDTASEIVRAR